MPQIDIVLPNYILLCTGCEGNGCRSKNFINSDSAIFWHNLRLSFPTVLKVLCAGVNACLFTPGKNDTKITSWNNVAFFEFVFLKPWVYSVSEHNCHIQRSP